MRFFHISDLHIGKQLYSYNLRENQRAILSQIVQYAKEYRPDAILICGDIFDKSVPSAEAYTVFDEFLNQLSWEDSQIPVLMIAGNHDNPQRLSYAKDFLEKHGFYIAVFPPATLEERVKKVTLSDEWGNVNFYLLPFLKPGYIRHLFPEGEVSDYNSAIARLLEREGLDDRQIDKKERHVLLSHQFYVNGGSWPEVCDSERRVLQTGGLDSVEVSLVEHFDYVALGHLHGAQKVKAPHIRYCGTPLKYSVSEEYHKKSITLVTLKEKGEAPCIETIPLIPLQEVRREKGTLEEILNRADEKNCHDFLSVTITDEQERFQPMEQLQEKYDYLLELRVDNQRTRAMAQMAETEEMQLQPMEVFAGFFQEMHKRPMEEEERALLAEILNETEEERV